MAKRRSNGEGSIRKRSDGRWEGRYTAGINSETGKAICKNVLGKTQAEVREKLKIAIENAKGLDIQQAEKYTLAQWMHLWYENFAKINLRPASHKTYEGYMKNHINPNIGDIPLAKLTTFDLQKFYKKLLTEGRVQRTESKNKPLGLSAKTVRNINQLISSSLDAAKAQKLILDNPTNGCTLPKVERQEMLTLSANQLEKFFAEAKETGVYELYYIELATGLRRGELLGLKWEDIDFTEATLKIRRQVLRINGEITEAPLKTKNAYRTIALGKDAVEILRSQENRLGKFSPYVFPSPTGTAMSPDSVLHMLHRVLKRAGLPKVRFHDLRHTFATLALQNGVDIKTVSGILGHFSAGFTLDTYTHTTTASQKEAANTMQNILANC